MKWGLINMEMVAIFNMIQFIGGIILSIGYIPQISKIVKTKSVKDFSVMYLLMLTTGIACMEAYAMYMWFGLHTAGAFMITNTIALMLAGTETSLVLYFRKKGGK